MRDGEHAGRFLGLVGLLPAPAAPVCCNCCHLFRRRARLSAAPGRPARCIACACFDASPAPAVAARSALSASVRDRRWPMPQFFSSVGNSRSFSRAASASVFGRVALMNSPERSVLEQHLGGRRVIAAVILLEVCDPALLERIALADAAGHFGVHAADDLAQALAFDGGRAASAAVAGSASAGSSPSCRPSSVPCPLIGAHHAASRHRGPWLTATQLPCPRCATGSACSPSGGRPARRRCGRAHRAGRRGTPP